MMNLTLYAKRNEVNSIEISEDAYKKLAEAGLENLADFNDIKRQIYGEEYEISATELIDESRKEFSYVKYLTELYREFSCQDNIYFSYN